MSHYDHHLPRGACLQIWMPPPLTTLPSSWTWLTIVSFSCKLCNVVLPFWIFDIRSLGALWAPTSRWRPSLPLDSRPRHLGGGHSGSLSAQVVWPTQNPHHHNHSIKRLHFHFPIFVMKTIGMYTKVLVAWSVCDQRQGFVTSSENEGWKIDLIEFLLTHFFLQSSKPQLSSGFFSKVRGRSWCEISSVVFGE